MESKLKQSLGLLDATLLVAGSMIGSGIFIVTAPMMRDIGSAAWMIVLWVLTGLITIFAALSYGELAGMMPNAGGQYVYIQRAYGKMMSFLYGWTVFTVIQTGVIAAVAVAFAKYAGVFFPVLNDVFLKTPIVNVSYGQLVAIGSIMVLTVRNSRGVQNGKILQLIFTAAKLFALFALIVFLSTVKLCRSKVFFNRCQYGFTVGFRVSALFTTEKIEKKVCDFPPGPATDKADVFPLLR